MFLPGLGAAVVVGAVLVAAPTAGAATPSCDGTPATIVVPLHTATATGTGGADVIYVDAINAVVDGLGGDDIICTSDASVAVLLGGEGRDRLTGRGTLDGGSGDDVLVSTGSDGAGVRGGDGNDQIVAEGPSGRAIYPGPGDDTIDSTASRGSTLDSLGFPSADGVTIGVPTGEPGAVDGEGHDTFVGRFRFYGTSGHDTFYGSSGDDTFYGLEGADTIFGFGGDDTLGAIAPAMIDGGGGDDLIFPEFGGLARGGPGDDVFDTRMEASEAGGRTVASAYHLFGGRGNDTFRLRTYSDEGRISRNPADGQRWRGAIAGGPDNDTVDLTPVGSAVVADLQKGRVRWGGGSSTLAKVDSVIGSSRHDVLRGNAGSNRLVGRAGDDLLIGRGGRDTANGGPGRDTCRQVERRVSCERR